MSRTFSLACAEAKLTLWVGQGNDKGMAVFYSDDPSAMARLGRFLEATRGKSLVLVCDDTQGQLVGDDFSEFEEDGYT